MVPDLLQLQLQAVVEYQTPAFTKHPYTPVHLLPNNFSPPGGNRGAVHPTSFQDQELDNKKNRPPTPIDEEQMETVREAGSLPQNTTSWFLEEYHGEHATYVQGISSSASRVPTVAAPLNSINGGLPKQLKTAVIPSSSQYHNATSHLRHYDGLGQSYFNTDSDSRSRNEYPDRGY